MIFFPRINTLSKRKHYSIHTFKAFADETISESELISVLNKVGNIVGTEENAGYQYFLLFP